MPQQVLILNAVGMGGTGAGRSSIARLYLEWPGMAISLVSAMQSLGFGPPTVAFMRDLHDSEAMGVETLRIYRNWQSRLHVVIEEAMATPFTRDGLALRPARF